MEERDHCLSKQYHRELLQIAADERLSHGAVVRHSSRLDHLLEGSGDLLISLGQRLKSHALKNQPATPELSGDCV